MIHQKINACLPGGTSSRLMVLLASVFLLLAGCGYNFVSSAPIDTVKLGEIKNMTLEPGMQDQFYETLALELVRKGISIDPSAPYTITGTLEKVAVGNLVMKDHLTVQYEVTVRGDFFLEGPGKRKRPLRKSNVFIVTFVRMGALEGVISERERAIKIALKDLSAELAAAILYDK